jgi:hypothetical protein
MAQAQCSCMQEQINLFESEVGVPTNDYSFLRSVWKSKNSVYNHALDDADDQLDRINKIVAMTKKHVNYNICK